MLRSRSMLSSDAHTVQRAEQAAATSSKPIVTRKFRRKALDPDERYAQERAKMEASRVQRAAQEELRQRRRAAARHAEGARGAAFDSSYNLQTPREIPGMLMSMIRVLKQCKSLKRTTVEAAAVSCY